MHAVCFLYRFPKVLHCAVVSAPTSEGSRISWDLRETLGRMPYAMGVPFVEEVRATSDEGTEIQLMVTFFPGGHTSAPRDHVSLWVSPLRGLEDRRYACVVDGSPEQRGSGESILHFPRVEGFFHKRSEGSEWHAVRRLATEASIVTLASQGWALRTDMRSTAVVRLAAVAGGSPHSVISAMSKTKDAWLSKRHVGELYSWAESPHGSRLLDRSRQGTYLGALGVSEQISCVLGMCLLKSILKSMGLQLYSTPTWQLIPKKTAVL
eukprot:s1355_g2.t1